MAIQVRDGVERSFPVFLGPEQRGLGFAPLFDLGEQSFIGSGHLGGALGHAPFERLVCLLQRGPRPVDFSDVVAHFQDERSAVGVGEGKIVDVVAAAVGAFPFPMMWSARLEDLERFTVVARRLALEQIFEAPSAVGFAETFLEKTVGKGHAMLRRQQHHVHGASFLERRRAAGVRPCSSRRKRRTSEVCSATRRSSSAFSRRRASSARLRAVISRKYKLVSRLLTARESETEYARSRTSRSNSPWVAEAVEAALSRSARGNFLPARHPSALKRRVPARLAYNSAPSAAIRNTGLGFSSGNRARSRAVCRFAGIPSDVLNTDFFVAMVCGLRGMSANAPASAYQDAGRTTDRLRQ